MSAPLSQPPLATSPKLKLRDFPKVLTDRQQDFDFLHACVTLKLLPSQWATGKKFMPCHCPQRTVDFWLPVTVEKLCASSLRLYKLSGNRENTALLVSVWRSPCLPILVSRATKYSYQRDLLLTHAPTCVRDSRLSKRHKRTYCAMLFLEILEQANGSIMSESRWVVAWG